MTPKILKLVFTILLTLFPFIGFVQQPVGFIQQIQDFNPDMGNITIKQDPAIELLLNNYYLQNVSRPGMQGFRIRIFFDLGQRSRANSLEVMNEFMENYPGIPIYRTFDSPYYKVSIGDFRTRDEALRELKRLSRKYPKAFIVPEWINFPRIN